MKFEIQGKEFIKDGKPIKLISGAVHYFRNMPDTWDDIFLKMRACGLNTVETYTAWNMHEPRCGEFCFEGRFNISEFIKKAGDAGLMVIVRPGPYICAEWEFGGLPWWLQNEPDMEIRCMNPAYIKYFDRYLDRLFAEIRPHLFTNGGPVIMLQCENEYGYYGDDKEYLLYLRDGYIRRGMNVPLFTSDWHEEGTLLDGSVDGCIPTLNFGSGVEERFKVHDRLFPNSPKMCMEMWNGWFDAWGDEKHHTTSAEDYAVTVRDMLNKGSLNMYMFIGGTNFGFTNGANHYEKFSPDVTSYDYDAPLTECGDVTPKYMALREVIKEFCREELPPVPENRPKAAYGRLALKKSASLFDNLERLSKKQTSNAPLPMERYGAGYGYILYESKLSRTYKDAELLFSDIGDRANVYLNSAPVGTVYVNDPSLSLKISANAGDTLQILVENMGRTNFGSKMMRKKGIIGRLLLDGKIHFGWEVYPLDMSDLSCIEYTDDKRSSGFFSGELTVDDAPRDTFIRLDGFTKGFVSVNGFNIGRFWDIGPQRTLYIPASLLRCGKNSITVFESDGLKGEPAVEFTDTPELG